MNSQRHFSQRRRAAFRPRLEHLETRDCPSCTVFQRGETLVIQGDREANHIEIAEIREGGLGEEGGGISVVCDGSVIQTFTGVKLIDLRTLGGDDEVTFVCPSDPSTFLFRADLGAGNDRLNISGFDPQPEPPIRVLAFDIHAGAGDDEVTFDLGAAPVNGRLAISADGGAGNDHLKVAIGKPCMLDGSELRIGLNGGGGDDVIEADLRNMQNQGRLVLEANGGAGNDHLVAAAGDGSVFPEGEARIGLLGGAGDDVIEASLTGLENYGRFVLEASGGAGNDRLEIVAIGKPCWLPESETQIKLNGDAGDDVIGASLTDLVNYGRFVLEANGGAGNDRMEVAAGNPCNFPESELLLKINGDAGDDVIEANVDNLMNYGRFALDVGGGVGNDVLEVGIGNPCVFPESELQIALSGDAGDDRIEANVDELMNSGLFALNVGGGGGNDFLEVGVGNPCNFPESETQIALSGDAGDDLIEANVDNLMNSGRFALDAGGGTGNDILEVFIGKPCMSPVSDTRIALSGDAGDDRIEANVNLFNSGHFALNVDGGGGNDRIQARVEIDEERGGALDVRILGGLGDDDLMLALYGVDVESLATALVDGGRGRDVAHVTRNVRVANCEEVFFLDDEGGLE